MLKLGYKHSAKGAIWLVGNKVVIGNGTTCDFIVKDPAIAEEHVSIFIQGDQATLIDLTGGINTYVNNEPVLRNRVLLAGDTIRIGSTELLISDPKQVRAPVHNPVKKVTGWYLKPVNHDLAENTIAVTDQLLVGRATDCDLCLSSPHISRRHAELYLVDGLLFVKDLISANGSFINDLQITEGRLRTGDLITFDQYSFVVIGPPEDQSKTRVRPKSQTMTNQNYHKTSTGFIPLNQLNSNLQQQELLNASKSDSSGFKLWGWGALLLILLTLLWWFNLIS
ncbi:FHA domain-containing protein [Spartinivicinus poritis]|uniref:FHA domain-containing protein n=1 Tax=Spartinivicinus poritis TaxID=2994640 RepID=A0ABT5UBA3_9GAMM|nr:FHA domain-containing protein [Spartinivicinus sp. A2-2]MDE1463659.1 FHA domain-containing protein [Spartinivicinus sp. A2-2]